MNNEARATSTPRSDRRTEIERISQEIEELSAQLHDLLALDRIEDEEGQRPRQNQNQIQPAAREFAIGNRIEVTNNYRNQRGRRGYITGVTPKQVTIRLDGDVRTYNKKKTSVRVITQEE